MTHVSRSVPGEVDIQSTLMPREVCLAPSNVNSCYPSKTTVLNLQSDPPVLIFKYIVLFLSQTSIMDIRLCVRFYIMSVILSFIANSCSKVKTLCWASHERHKPELTAAHIFPVITQCFVF